MQPNLLQLAADFIQTLQTRTSFEELTKFYHPEVEHIEYPNAVTKNTKISSLDDLRQASERGKALLLKEEYEILKSYVFDNTVIIECTWAGTLAIPVGALHAGEQMKAHFAQIFEYRDGLILRQRNYDCFDPFV